jgi:hypothetical protein
MKRRRNRNPIPKSSILSPSIALDPLSVAKLAYVQSFYLDYLKVPASTSSIFRRSLDSLLTDIEVCIQKVRNASGPVKVSAESKEADKMVYANWLRPGPSTLSEATPAVNKEGQPVTWTEASADKNP